MNKLYKNKLNDILNIIEKNHIDFYFNHSKEELENFKSEALSKYKLEDDYDLYYIVNYIIKKMVNENDSHTILYFKGDNEDTLGLNFRFINNKLYIYKAVDECSKYLYSEVLKINGIYINTIIEELDNMICSQTNGGREFKIEQKLFMPNHLKCLPSIDSNTNEFKITVNNNGVVEEFILPKGKILKPNYKYYIDNNIMRIIYSQCKENYQGQMQDFVNEISKINNIDTYIVDLRGNMGGNSLIIKPLIEFLKDKKVVVLIDKYVFSSGSIACDDLKMLGATFIGTDIGTTMNCFGDCLVEEYGTFIVFASKKYFGVNDGKAFGTDSKEYLDNLKNANPKIFEPIYFHPDIYVEESIDYLKASRDIYLETAYEYIKNNKLRK